MPTQAVVLVTAWETAAGLTPPVRTAALLAALGLATDREAALEHDVGSATRLLAAGYTEAFGPRAELVADCPACGETLEATVDVAAVTTAAPGPPTVRLDHARVRLPTLRELAAVHGGPDAAQTLRGWCVEPDPQGGGDGSTPTPEAVDAALEQLADAALPHAPVHCPACGGQADDALDLAALLWEHLQREAPRLLTEVATLAAAFGWTESEVLSLSPTRRRAYLQLAGAGP